ncbi:hypothetical protein [Amycolatopsis speibonae]|uniref:Uncharacterized protein n=1 Tax=Amycolatopsis speibonae TaxID=1450224 RepID=A0ABV7P279_9PSEU
MTTDSPSWETGKHTTLRPRRPPDYTLPTGTESRTRQLDLDTRARAVRTVCRLVRDDADRATLLAMLGLATDHETF